MNTDEYFDNYLEHLLPIQDELLNEEKKRNDICPSTGKDIGRLLYILIRLCRPDQVLEIGTSVGYSAIWMGLALQETGGRLITVESSERLLNEACANIKRAGLEDTVKILSGQAQEVVPALGETFGMIFQDGGTQCYPEMLDILSDRLRPGGLLVADDVLFALRADRKKPRQYMQKYNEELFGHRELFSTLLDAGNGLSVSIKKQDTGGKYSD